MMSHIILSLYDGGRTRLVAEAYLGKAPIDEMFRRRAMGSF